ncbi:aldo/keto reductase [Nocardia sp. NPDC006982]|uniref:aldo/keto reductase n=1 Tax=Nocardia sp. NPDC006982 TaxID=3364307 RepID=UPI003690871B
MKYPTLGRSGLRVSEAFLGAMGFGEDWGWGASIAECRKMFTAYAEAGGNVIDTANRYTEGSSERIVGDLLAAERDRFVLATSPGHPFRQVHPHRRYRRIAHQPRRHFRT